MISKVTFEVVFDNIELTDQAAVDALRHQVLLYLKPLYQQMRFDKDVSCSAINVVEV